MKLTLGFPSGHLKLLANGEEFVQDWLPIIPDVQIGSVDHVDLFIFLTASNELLHLLVLI